MTSRDKLPSFPQSTRCENRARTSSPRYPAPISRFSRLACSTTIPIVPWSGALAHSDVAKVARFDNVAHLCDFSSRERLELIDVLRRRARDAEVVGLGRRENSGHVRAVVLLERRERGECKRRERSMASWKSREAHLATFGSRTCPRHRTNHKLVETEFWANFVVQLCNSR